MHSVIVLLGLLARRDVIPKVNTAVNAIENTIGAYNSILANSL